MGLMDQAEGKPLCKKCGGKTVATLDPDTFETKRKCVECEVRIVESEDHHPHAEAR